MGGRAVASAHPHPRPRNPEGWGRVSAASDARSRAGRALRDPRLAAQRVQATGTRSHSVGCGSAGTWNPRLQSWAGGTCVDELRPVGRGKLKPTLDETGPGPHRESQENPGIRTWGSSAWERVPRPGDPFPAGAFSLLWQQGS